MTGPHPHGLYFLNFRPPCGNLVGDHLNFAVLKYTFRVDGEVLDHFPRNRAELRARLVGE